MLKTREHDAYFRSFGSMFSFFWKNTVFWIFFDSVQIVVYRLIVSVLLASICFWRNVRRQLSVEFNRSPLHSLLTSTVNSTVKNFCGVIRAHFLISSLQPFNSIQLPHFFLCVAFWPFIFHPNIPLGNRQQANSNQVLAFSCLMTFISLPGYFECLQFPGVVVRWKWKFTIFTTPSLCIDSDSFSINLQVLHALSLQHSTFNIQHFSQSIHCTFTFPHFRFFCK